MTKEDQCFEPGFDAVSLVGAEVFAPKKEEEKIANSIELKLDEILAGQKLLNEKLDNLQKELRNASIRAMQFL